jgi:hypothetical protein
MAGWSPNTLTRAVYDRLTGDTGTGGLRNSSSPLVASIHAREAPIPTPSSFPYLVFFVTTVTGEEAFDAEKHIVGFEAEWFVEEQASGVDAVERSGLILERLVGDVTDQSSGVPTYGLSRWAPTLQTGWLAAPIEFMAASDVSDTLGVIRWTASFEVQVSKVGGSETDQQTEWDFDVDPWWYWG